MRKDPLYWPELTPAEFFCSPSWKPPDWHQETFKKEWEGGGYTIATPATTSPPPLSGGDMSAVNSVFVSSEAMLRKSQKYILPCLLLCYYFFISHVQFDFIHTSCICPQLPQWMLKSTKFFVMHLFLILIMTWLTLLCIGEVLDQFDLNKLKKLEVHSILKCLQKEVCSE